MRVTSVSPNFGMTLSSTKEKLEHPQKTNSQNFGVMPDDVHHLLEKMGCDKELVLWVAGVFACEVKAAVKLSERRILDPKTWKRKTGVNFSTFKAGTKEPKLIKYVRAYMPHDIFVTNSQEFEHFTSVLEGAKNSYKEGQWNLYKNLTKTSLDIGGDTEPDDTIPGLIDALIDGIRARFEKRNKG